MKAIYLIVICLIFSGSDLKSQITYDSLRNEIGRLNSAYSTALALKFDVQVILNSDTISGYFVDEKEAMTYSISNGNYYFATRGAEFAQDDSFSVTVMKEEKTILLSKQQTPVDKMMPLKIFVDSALFYYLQVYDVAITNLNNVSKEINFSTDSSWAFYKRIRIRYSPTTFLMQEVEFEYMQQANPRLDNLDPSGVPIPESLPILRHKLLMRFAGHQQRVDEGLANHNRYVIFDFVNNRYMGNGAYRGYRIVASNIASTSEENTRVERVTPAATFRGY